MEILSTKKPCEGDVAAMQAAVEHLRHKGEFPCPLDVVAAVFSEPKSGVDRAPKLPDDKPGLH